MAPDVDPASADSLLANLRAVVAELGSREDFDYCAVSDRTGIAKEHLQLAFPTLDDLRSMGLPVVPDAYSGKRDHRPELSERAERRPE